MMGTCGDKPIGLHSAAACGFCAGVLSCWGYASPGALQPGDRAELFIEVSPVQYLCHSGTKSFRIEFAHIRSTSFRTARFETHPSIEAAVDLTTASKLTKRMSQTRGYNLELRFIIWMELELA